MSVNQNFAHCDMESGIFQRVWKWAELFLAANLWLIIYYKSWNVIALYYVVLAVQM